MKKKIFVDIMDDGEIKIETHNFTGKSCVEESQWLKDLLGEETARELKPCYWRKDNKKMVKKHLPLCG